MKKVLIIIFSLILLLETSCKSKKIQDNNRGEINMITNQKSLVLYFSATGTTEKVAQKISNTINSDIIEIIPKNKYTTDDLNYNNDNCRANQEQNNPQSRPEIENSIDIEEYDTIYIGYPIWWGTNPRIILSLLDKFDFEGKNIILFCTSGGSGIEQSISDLKAYNNKINILGGKKFNSNVTSEEIENWINTFNLNNQVNKIYIKVNNKILSAVLENNTSSKELVEKLKQNDMTIEMSDYGNFEKVGKLDFSLPTNDKQITTEVGDIILYQGNLITIYYDTNSWNFTKLGKIENINQNELKEILGKENVVVTFSLSNK